MAEQHNMQQSRSGSASTNAALFVLPRKRTLASGVAACVMGALSLSTLSGQPAQASLIDSPDRADRFMTMQSVNDVEANLFHDIELSSPRLSTVQTALHDAAEQTCLAEGIYFEARSESLAGQKAIAEVIHNRVESRYYPSTICGVVYQGAERALTSGKHNCQFSFACDGSMDRWTPTGIAWERAQHLAAISLEGGFAPQTREATHYHANYVRPGWSKRLKRTATVGKHKFYQDLPYRRLAAQRERAALGTLKAMVSAAP